MKWVITRDTRRWVPTQEKKNFVYTDLPFAHGIFAAERAFIPTQEEKFIRYGIFAAGRVVVLTQEKKISRVWDLRACRDAY